MSKEIPHEYWIQTFMGDKLDFLNPKIETLKIESIANGLAQESRFGGQGRFFYSVCQHSINACELAPENLKLEGLLHDFPEGLGLKDLPGPIKRLLGMRSSTNVSGFNEYKYLETKLLILGIEAFGLSYINSDWKIIKDIDRRLARTEELSLMSNQWHSKTERIELEPYDIEICELPWREVRDKFLSLYKKYKRI